MVREHVRNVAPLRRSGQPGALAEIVVTVAGSSSVTGQVVTVDGGLTFAT
ncbi:MAG: SDR family oxidoreductase [Acidimicrobiales bacterium]